MKQYLCLTLALVLLSGVVAFAQDRAQGIVKDEKGRGMAGVSVTVQGTRISTLTDLNGTFFLDDVEPGTVLEFTAIGYKTRQAAWSKRPLTIVLKEKGDGHFIVMGSVGLGAPMTYGGTFGYVDKVGFYVTARHNFKFANGAMEASNGVLSDGTALWTETGAKTFTSVFHVGGGVVIRATKWLYPYVGASYHKSDVIWEDYRGEKVKMKDYSSAGLGATVGLMARLGMFGLSGGADYNFERGVLEGEVGVGFFF